MIEAHRKKPLFLSEQRLILETLVVMGRIELPTYGL
jgi:hypothetical protein